ncbi:MAG TPA: hypothetical protein VK420_11380 [Longimicrobium sp.]|nr:hypothetical protein [Longimicrobium sp.]
MRAKIQEGFTPEIFFGRIDVKAFGNFLDGIGFYTFCAGVKDEPFREFMEWLWEKGEHRDPGGWEARYLTDCNGDHRAAIMKFLDRCAEFVAQRQPPESGPR